jgi:hypothetical protein
MKKLKYLTPKRRAILQMKQLITLSEKQRKEREKEGVERNRQ